jgi:molybdate transport system substrate-binding protein
MRRAAHCGARKNTVRHADRAEVEAPWPRRGALALALALIVGFFAMSARAAELNVAAAASLREPLTAIARHCEQLHPGLHVQLSFGASSVLAMQVRAGAPIDVLVSADARIADDLARAGLVAARRGVARNRLVVIASREAAPRIEAPADLAAPDVRRIAIPQHAVPVGRYAREWLARRGLLEAVNARTVQTEHARATLVAVDQGHADAAIVYASDARLARSARVAFEIPDDEQPHIEYVAVTLTGARAPALAETFLAFLGGTASREILAAAGFAAPVDASAEGSP